MSTSKEANPLAWIAASIAAIVVVGGIAINLLSGPALGQQTPDQSEQSGQSLNLETIRRGDLTETKESTASVAYGDGWEAPFDAQGTVTKRHEVNHIVASGEPLLWLDTKPVILATGEAPMYRTLYLNGTKVKQHLQGQDVEQLQTFLTDQGHTDKDRLAVDGIFGASTRRAVIEWQKANNLKATGSVDRSQIVFHPNSVRIASAPQLGSTFASLQISDAKQKITAVFDRKTQPFLPVGGTVQLEVGNETVDSTIEKVESEINDRGESELKVSLSVPESLPIGTTRVKASATRETASDALIVPVRAIVALAGGGYAVEVDTGSGPELRRVELGAVAEDLVEVEGDVVEGDSVVVPVDPISGGSS